MSAFLGLTPTVRIRIENSFLGKAYPSVGAAVAVVDTGYEGFLAVPKDVFRRVSLQELQLTKRTLLLADGRPLGSEGVLATLVVPELASRLYGFVECYDGLEEIILGTTALARFKMLFDYCVRKFRIEKCP